MKPMDKVRVKPLSCIELPNNHIYFTDEMEKYCGRIFIIAYINELGDIWLKDNDFLWRENWLEPIEVFGDTNRTFESGAIRDTTNGKLEYYGFMHPICDQSFAKYMHEHRKMPDGSMRDSNNWWGGFGKETPLQSLTRHLEDLKAIHAGYIVIEVRLKDGSVNKKYLTSLDSHCEENEEEYIKIITEEDCCNAIRFNSDAYKLEVLKDE